MCLRSQNYRLTPSVSVHCDIRARSTHDHGSRTNDAENSRDDEHLLVVTRLLHVNTSQETGSRGEDSVGDEVETSVGRRGLLDGGEVEGDLVDDSEPVRCVRIGFDGPTEREVTN